MDLKKSEDWIKTSIIITLFLAGLTFLTIFISMIWPSFPVKSSWWSLIDVAFFIGLAYGVYLKSRICSVILFTWFVISQFITIITMKSVVMAPLAFIFSYFLFKGMQATFIYHRGQKEKEKWNKRFSLLSFIFSLIVWSTAIILLIISLIIINTAILPEGIASPLLIIFLAIVIFANIILSCLGIGFGIVGIVKKEQKRKMATIGIVFNGLFALIYMAVLIPSLLMSNI